MTSGSLSRDERSVWRWLVAGAVVAAMHAAAGFYLYSLPGAPSGPSAPAIVQFKLEPMVVQADAPSQSQAQGSEGQDAPKRVESTVVAPEAAVPETTPVLEAVNDAPAQPEIVDEPIEPAIAVPAPDRLEGVPPELRQDTAIPVPTIEATDPAADPAILPDALEAEALAPEIAEEQPESIVTVPLPPRLEGVPSQLQATMPPAKPTPRVAPPAEAKPPASKPRVERMTRLQKAAKPEAKLERKEKPATPDRKPIRAARPATGTTDRSGGQGTDARARTGKAAASQGKSVSPARWQAQVIAHIRRFQRFPQGAARPGSVRVQVQINERGVVKCVSVTGSSGDPVLDRAAIDMVRRASPVPAPPVEVARPSMILNLTISYRR